MKRRSLQPILDVTYGCMVYQEQVMQIVRDLAGYSYGRSDLVRRAMAKKKTGRHGRRSGKTLFYGMPKKSMCPAAVQPRRACRRGRAYL